MSTSFHPTLNNHDCKAVVLCCMDFRYHKAIVDHVTNELGIPDFDLITEAGGVRYIAEQKKHVMDDMLAELDISFHLHHVDTIVLINHEDCGGYGGKSAFDGDDHERESHHSALKTAKDMLLKDHPEANIIPLYTYFEGDEIKFEQVG